MRAANLNDIIAFVETVDTGSFAAAARRLRLSRSTVAKAVGRLEMRLGSRLLSRTTRSLGVTEDGRRFYEQCSVVLDDLQAAEDSAAGLDVKPRGLLRITVPEAYGRLHIIPVARRFLAQWPDISIELNITDRIIDIVEEGFDLAIRIGGLGELPQELISRVIAKYPTMFCAAPSYIALHGKPETLDSLRDHDCLPYVGSRVRTTAQHPWRMLTEEGSWRPIGGRTRFKANGGEAVLDAVVAGMGVAYLPAFLTERHINEGRLVALPLDHRTGEIPVFALYPSKRYLPAKVRTFIDTLATASSDVD